MLCHSNERDEWGKIKSVFQSVFFQKENRPETYVPKRFFFGAGNRNRTDLHSLEGCYTSRCTIPALVAVIIPWRRAKVQRENHKIRPLHRRGFPVR